MFKIGDIIDKKYEVIEICHSQGGMGTVVFVKETSKGNVLALKYCVNPDYFERFRREVRIMKLYKDNSKVVQILDDNLDYQYPYFVMPKAKGNLSMLFKKIQEDTTFQEKVLNRLIDCVGELHEQGHIHRDIKPQNYLVYEDDVILVSDFGLALEPDSETRVTNTLAMGGTEEFAPPEFFQPGGFKNASKTWDIHSLGKSIYRILTNKDARFLTSDGLEPSIFYVIERSTRSNKSERYQTHSEMKQGLKNSYDVILNRVDVFSQYESLNEKIIERLKRESKYSGTEVIDLIDCLNALNKAEQEVCIKNFSERIIKILCSHHKFKEKLKVLLSLYREVVDHGTYEFSYAEAVASEMSVIFNEKDLDDQIRCDALEIAIICASKMNRFKAMSDCESMITSIDSANLALRVADLINKHGGFLLNIEPINCKHSIIRKAINNKSS